MAETEYQYGNLDLLGNKLLNFILDNLTTDQANIILAQLGAAGIVFDGEKLRFKINDGTLLTYLLQGNDFFTDTIDSNAPNDKVVSALKVYQYFTSAITSYQSAEWFFAKTNTDPDNILGKPLDIYVKFNGQTWKKNNSNIWEDTGFSQKGLRGEAGFSGGGITGRKITLDITGISVIDLTQENPGLGIVELITDNDTELITSIIWNPSIPEYKEIEFRVIQENKIIKFQRGVGLDLIQLQGGIQQENFTQDILGPWDWMRFRKSGNQLLGINQGNYITETDDLNLDELADVIIDTEDLEDQDVLIWDQSSSVWRNVRSSSMGGGGIPIGNIVYVSEIGGNNDTGTIGMASKPFADIEHGMDATPIDGMLHIIYGTYTWDTGICKEGIIITADPGTIINIVDNVVDISTTSHPLRIFMPNTTINYTTGRAFNSTANYSGSPNHLILGDILTNQTIDVFAVNIENSGSLEEWDIKLGRVQGSVNVILNNQVLRHSRFNAYSITGTNGNNYSAYMYGINFNINFIKNKPLGCVAAKGYIEYLQASTGHNQLGGFFDLEVEQFLENPSEGALQFFDIQNPLTQSRLKVIGDFIKHVDVKIIGTVIDCSILLDISCGLVLDIQNSANFITIVKVIGNIRIGSGSISYPYLAKVRQSNSKLIMEALLIGVNYYAKLFDCTEGEIILNSNLIQTQPITQTLNGNLQLDGGKLTINGDLDFQCFDVYPILFNSGDLFVNGTIRSLGIMVGIDSIIRNLAGNDKLHLGNNTKLVALGSGMVYSISAASATTIKNLSGASANLPTNNITNSLSLGAIQIDTGVE